MPQLHANQIQFQAPDPAHINVLKEQNLLSREFDRLAGHAERLSDTMDKINDVELAEKMRQAADDAANALRKVKRTDNNYAGVKAELMTSLQQQFQDSPEDAQVRFARNNPQFMEATSLEFDKIIFKKFQDYETEHAKQLSGRLASNVTRGLIDYQSAKKQLEKVLDNLDPVVAKQIGFNFDDSVSKTNVARLARKGAYSEALRDARDPNRTPTWTPEYRENQIRVLTEAWDAAEKAKAKTLQKLLSNDDGMTDSEKTKYLVNIGQTLAEMTQDPQFGDVYSDIYFQYQEALADPQKTIKFSIDIPSLGIKAGDEMSFADQLPAVRHDAVEKNKQYEELYPVINEEIYNFLNDVNFTYDTAVAQTKNKGDEVLATDKVLKNLVGTTMFEQYVPKDRKTQIREYIANKNRTLNAAFETPDSRGRVVSYYTKDLKSKAGLRAFGQQVAGGGATGFSLGAVTGNPAAALIGGGLGVAGAAALYPFSEYDAPTGAQVLHMAVDNEAQYNALSRGNLAEQQLYELPVAARQATQKARQILSEQDNIDIEYGTAGEYILNLHAYLTSASAKQLSDMGLSPYLIQHAKLEGSLRDYLGLLQSNGLINNVLSQDRDEEQAKAFRQELFDGYLLYLQNGEFNLTDEQKQVRNRVQNVITGATTGKGGWLENRALQREERSVREARAPSTVTAAKEYQERIKKRQEKGLNK